MPLCPDYPFAVPIHIIRKIFFGTYDTLGAHAHSWHSTFALGGFTPTNGMNQFTAIASDMYGHWSTNTSTVNVILTNNAYAYDSNGNLTFDGYKNFAYDDENELIGVWVSGAWSNSFAYDGKMRRRTESDYSWDAGISGWVETNEVHFIYDGNVVVEERNAGNIRLVSYTRGNDLSGTLQGAGGIAGLLARTMYGQELPGAPTTTFYHADGNGNITALMYPDQQLAAKYLYDPFGNMLAMGGPLMDYNKYRFSSKEWNDNSELYYYGYRFYDPSLQRWPTRDPLGDAASLVSDLIAGRISFWLNFFREQGMPNTYKFVDNEPLANCDLIGLICWCDHSTDYDPKSCMDCAEQNDSVRRMHDVLVEGVAAAGKAPADNPISDTHDIIRISDLGSAAQQNLYRGALAQGFLNCLAKWGGGNAQEVAKQEFNKHEHLNSNGQPAK